MAEARDKLFTVKVLGASMGVTVAALTVLALYQKHAVISPDVLVARQRFEAVTTGQIYHLDEVLTMSARLGAATGDARWEERYKTYAPKLDAAIEDALAFIPKGAKTEGERLVAGNAALVAMELRAFQLIREGRRAEALKLVTGGEYERHKRSYVAALEEVKTSVRLATMAMARDFDTTRAAAAKLKAACLGLILLTWGLALWLIYRQSLKRVEAEAQLRQVHEDLEAVVAERTIKLQEANAALYATIKSREQIERYQKVQLEVAGIVAKATGEDSSLLKVIESICRNLDWNVGAVWEVDDSTQLLVCSDFYRMEPLTSPEDFETVTRETKFKKGIGLPGRVWVTGVPLWISDIQKDANFPRLPCAKIAGLHSAFALPIVSSGRIRGVLEFFRKDIMSIDQGLLESMRVLGVHLGQVLERDQARKLQEETLSQLIQAQKMEAVGKLAGGVAHDFNNILSAILGYCDLLIPSFPPDDPRLQDVRDVSESANRAAGLTRQLLAFSRRQVLMPAVVDVNALVSNLMRMLKRLVREDVVLRTELKPGLGCALIDAGQFEQVIVNLVVNACDAIAKHGDIVISTSETTLDARACERLKGLKPGPHVVLSVKDSGSGMSTELAAKVFEPFFTTKGPGKGTGLGLSTVYGIVQQSGGAVDIVTALDKGSCFSIYLPAVAQPAAQPVVENPSGRPQGMESVLLVEDEEKVRSVVRRMLTKQGYTIFEAANAEEALKIFELEHPDVDLLLTDVVMPGMSGRELALVVRRKRPGLKILFMSGYADSLVVQKGSLELGQSFMEKPFTADMLARKVRAILDGPEGKPVKT